MDFHAPGFCKNEQLSALPPAELSQLRPLLTRVSWINGQGLHEAGEHIEQVFFVEQGAAAMMADTESGSSGTEVGLVGREGLVDLPVLLSPAAASFHRAVVQMPGDALRMPAPALRGSLDALPVLRGLLMAHDRSDGDNLALTQEFLSTMLAVRRSGVSVAMQALQAAGVVGQARGHVTICDRPGLEAAACGCYGRVQAFIAAAAARNPCLVDCAA